MRVLRPTLVPPTNVHGETALKPKHQITRAAEYESLAAFRQLIEQACQEYPQIDAPTVYDLQLAADEACTNIIQHGYAGMDPGSIIFTIEPGPRQVRLTITDFGQPFEPYEPEAPDLEAAQETQQTGGFGLFFIYQVIDQVDYSTTCDGNQLTLIKQLSKEQ